MRKTVEVAVGNAKNITRCPNCGGKVAVYDSRVSKHGQRRGRKCLKCGFRYSTVEVMIAEYNDKMKQMEDLKKEIECHKRDMETVKRIFGVQI